MLIRRVKNFVKYFSFKPAIYSLIILAGVLVAGQTRAATLYLSPSVGSGSIGKTFMVAVYVSSRDGAINAASGVVNFPKDKLELVSLSKSGSIFNLWVAEPSFSQSAGTFSFEGIILNPGYTGAAGKIAWANFRVKAGGVAKFDFASGAVLANDGEGTNILSGFGSATFNLVDDGTKPAPAVEAPKPSSVPPPVPPPATDGSTTVPKIISETNPDQEKWYSSSRVKLSWLVPSSVTALRLLLSSSASDVPTITYIPPINFKELPNVDDGVYYFSARFKDAKGWGGVARYILRLDTKPPGAFTIGLPDGEVTANVQPSLKLATLDTTSGLDHWLVKINDGPAMTVRPEEIINELYALPPQNPGTKHIVVEAYDKAGNKTSASATMEIEGEIQGKNLALTSWPERVVAGANITIKGKTSGSNQITIYWQKDQEPVVAGEAVSDVRGNFTFVATAKDIGDYQVWAVIKDQDGLIVASSDKVSIAVREGLVAMIGKFLAGFWWLLLLIVAGVLVYVFGPSLWRRRGRSGNHHHLNRVLYTSVHSLRDGIKAQVKVLAVAKAKRRLSREETAVILGLKKTLSNTDRFLAKEIVIIKKKRQAKPGR